MADTSHDYSVKKNKITGARGDNAREDFDQFTVMQETTEVDLSAREMSTDSSLPATESAAAMGVLGTSKEIPNDSITPVTQLTSPANNLSYFPSTTTDNQTMQDTMADTEALPNIIAGSDISNRSNESISDQNIEGIKTFINDNDDSNIEIEPMITVENGSGWHDMIENPDRDNDSPDENNPLDSDHITLVDLPNIDDDSSAGDTGEL